MVNVEFVNELFIKRKKDMFFFQTLKLCSHRQHNYGNSCN